MLLCLNSANLSKIQLACVTDLPRDWRTETPYRDAKTHLKTDAFKLLLKCNIHSELWQLCSSILHMHSPLTKHSTRTMSFCKMNNTPKNTETKRTFPKAFWVGDLKEYNCWLSSPLTSFSRLSPDFGGLWLTSNGLPSDLSGTWLTSIPSFLTFGFIKQPSPVQNYQESGREYLATRLFTRSLVMPTHLFTPHCSLRSPTHSRARKKVNE